MQPLTALLYIEVKKMNLISVDTLKPGMIFTEPVYIEGENILVPAGVKLKKKDIDRLKSWDISTVATNGKLEEADTKSTDKKSADSKKPAEPAGSEPAAKQVKKTKANAISLAEVQENNEVYRSYKDFIERLNEIFDDIGMGLSIESRSIDSISNRLIQTVRENRNSVIGFILGGEVSGFELAKSSINAAILSALIAIELKLPNHKVMKIVSGALLHDIGMLRLPKELVSKRGGLSEAEMLRMQAHPIYAHRIVTKELLYPEEVGFVVVQHHERWDGEGYPRKLMGDAIDIGARIVSVADAFEAMVSQKPYRNSMVGYQAMKNLLSDNSRRFDPDVLKAFIQTMGIYPIGSIIVLNNSALARVVEVQGTAPLRPKIRILIDEKGNTLKQDEGEIIDLLKDKHLFIAKAVDPKDLVSKDA